MKGQLRFLFLSILCSTLYSPDAEPAARPIIQVTVDPPQSPNGEMIQFKVLIRQEGNAPIRPPKMPLLAEWKVLNVFDSNSVSSSLMNGRLTTKYEHEYTWVLKPQRTGTLTIPALDVWIGTARYKTEAIQVPVQRLVDGSTRSTPLTPLPSQDEDEEDPWLGQMPQLPGGRRSNPQYAAPPSRQNFFVRAEADPTTVYQGELITLSYVLYEKRPSISNPEIKKFPDFKGFLKEELDIPKTLTRTPVNLQGEPYFRSELIRYAVFPLRTGKLKIQPLRFKADYIASPIDDMMGQLMGGSMPPGFLAQGFGGHPTPMQKSTRTVEIVSKPLPAAPEGAAFTGGVGQFSMDVVGPSGPLAVDQPFTITLTVRGRGNIKVIEEPPLKLPKNLEPFQTKNSYEFKADASGYKTFEYLILPRSPGSYKVDPLTWTYFDPQKAQYITLSSQPLEFQVGAGTGAPHQNESQKTPEKETPRTWSPLVPGPQIFVPSARSNHAQSVPAGAWYLLGALYLTLFAYYGRRRQLELTEAHFQKAPWEKTARKLAKKKSGPRAEIAVLVDQWIRERLAGWLAREDLHSESSRDELIEALKQKIHAEDQRYLPPLKKLWEELDLLRFSGESSQEPLPTQALFLKAQQTVAPLVKKKDK